MMWSERVRAWLESYAKMQGCTVEEAIAQIVNADYDECVSLGRKWGSRKEKISALWIRRVAALTTLEEEAARIEAEREERREEKRQKYLNAELKKVDFSALERDTKTASGYAGVYAHRKGWRAFVQHLGKGQYLRTRTLPELAAWDRYQWHVKNDVPYGDSARSIEAMLRGPAAGTDPEVLASEQEALERWNKGEIGATDGAMVWAERQARKALREAEEAKPARGRPRKKRPIYLAKAGTVTWVDQFRVVVEHTDDTATSYRGLDEISVAKGTQMEAGGLLGFVLGAIGRIFTAEVPPPSKILGTAPKPPEPKFAPTSPHYAEQKHHERVALAERVARERALMSNEEYHAQPPVEDVEPDDDFYEGYAGAMGVPGADGNPIEPIEDEPEPTDAEPEIAIEPRAPVVSIFDPNYKPAPVAPVVPGRFAHIRSVPKPPAQLAAEVRATLEEVDDVDAEPT